MATRAVAHTLLAASLIVSAALASGCLRRRFDLCSETPPHAECPSRDAGSDASIDAPEASDVGLVDAGADAGADASTDAGADAGTDAGADAGTDAAGAADSGPDAP